MKLNNAWEALKRTVLGPVASGNTTPSEPDGFPVEVESPHYASHRLINDFYAALPEPKVAFRVKSPCS